MSFLDKASLVLIPSGTKNGTVFCQKPTGVWQDSTGDYDGQDGTGFNGQLDLTRASNATYVNSDGLVVPPSYENAVSYSDPSGPEGPASGVGYSPYSWGVEGLTRAITYSAVGTFVYHYAGSLNFGAPYYTISAYVVMDDGSAPRVGSRYSSDYDMSIVAFGRVISEDPRQVTIENVQGNIYRIQATVEFKDFYFSETNNGIICYGYNQSGKGFKVSGLQMEESPSATSYKATNGAPLYSPSSAVINQPRLDYTGSTYPKLLLEPQRTNYLRYSSTNVGASFNVNVTYELGTTVCPDGFNTGIEINGIDYVGEHYYGAGGFSLTGGGTYTFSVFAKKNTSSLVQLAFPDLSIGGYRYATYDLDTQTVTKDATAVSASMEDYGNGWYRLILTATPTDGFYNNCVGFTNTTSECFPDIDADGYSVYLWGFQTELSSYATSYIPTTYTSVTRIADTCSKTGVSDVIGQTEGTLFAEFEGVETSVFTNLIPTISDGTINNSIKVYYDPNVSGIRAFIRTAGSLQTNTAVAATLNAGTNKIAVSYKLNDLKVYLNGSQIIIDGSISVPATSKVSLFSDEALTVQEKIEGKQALIFPTALTATQMAELTA